MITLSLTRSTHLNSLLHLTPPPLTPACGYPNISLSHPHPLTHTLSHAHHHRLTFLIDSLPLYSSSKPIISSHSLTHNHPLPPPLSPSLTYSLFHSHTFTPSHPHSCTALRDRGLQRAHLPFPRKKSAHDNDFHMRELLGAVSHKSGG